MAKFFEPPMLMLNTIEIEGSNYVILFESRSPKSLCSIVQLRLHLDSLFFTNLFYYSAYFCYYSWDPLHFLVLFMGLTVLFQLIVIFIYSTFNKKFSI